MTLNRVMGHRENTGKTVGTVLLLAMYIMGFCQKAMHHR